MRSPVSIAVITDVHGNALALEAVIKDVRKHAPDLIANLGDQVWGQVDPLTAYEMQATLGAVEVRGNNDEKPCLDASRLTRGDAEFSRWLTNRVPQKHLSRLNALPTTAQLIDGAVLIAHGTPSSTWENLLWQPVNGVMMPRDNVAVAQSLSVVPDAMEGVVVGHTHLERQVTIGSRLVVNAGPVAWQKDGDPRARWTLLKRGAEGWTVAHRKVVYDWNAAAEAVLSNQPVLDIEAFAHTEGRDQRYRMLESGT